jgi:hypothetical protein
VRTHKESEINATLPMHVGTLKDADRRYATVSSNNTLLLSVQPGQPKYSRHWLYISLTREDGQSMEF